jgi:hypothetical protein
MIDGNISATLKEARQLTHAIKLLNYTQGSLQTNIDINSMTNKGTLESLEDWIK